MNRNRRPGPDNTYSIVELPGPATSVWLFRLSLILLAYLTVGLLDWLLQGADTPWLDALAPAAGLMLGFLLFGRLEIWARRH